MSTIIPNPGLRGLARWLYEFFNLLIDFFFLFSVPWFTIQYRMPVVIYIREVSIQIRRGWDSQCVGEEKSVSAYSMGLRKYFLKCWCDPEEWQLRPSPVLFVCELDLLARMVPGCKCYFNKQLLWHSSCRHRAGSGGEHATWRTHHQLPPRPSCHQTTQVHLPIIARSTPTDRHETSRKCTISALVCLLLAVIRYMSYFDSAPAVILPDFYNELLRYDSVYTGLTDISAPYGI